MFRKPTEEEFEELNEQVNSEELIGDETILYAESVDENPDEAFKIRYNPQNHAVLVYGLINGEWKSVGLVSLFHKDAIPIIIRAISTLSEREDNEDEEDNP